jgi:hypothetical protein
LDFENLHEFEMLTVLKIISGFQKMSPNIKMVKKFNKMFVSFKMFRNLKIFRILKDGHEVLETLWV